MKKILFVCRYNRFRSVLAEAFFNKYNKYKSQKAKSAGVIKGTSLGDNVKQLAREFNLTIKKSPQGLTAPVMKWQNVTVLVADDIPPELFDKNKTFGKKVIVWKIPDVNGGNFNTMRVISKKIKKNVEKLIIQLNEAHGS